MIVTDKELYLDPMLKSKIDIMIKRCTQPNPKRDALLLIEGGEGEGKTTLASTIAYYVHFITGRQLNNSNFFFSAKVLLEFAQNTEGQIIIYDEPALDMLNAEWWKEEQRNLIKLLMTARKKRHFFIFNITKFFKFNEYIVVDRALGMAHVYSKNEVLAGRFVYIRKRNLEYLYNTYRSSKKRKYKRFASFHGKFLDCLEKIIDSESYDIEKNKAIMSIGKQHKLKKSEVKAMQTLRKLKSKIPLLIEKGGLTNIEAAAILGYEQSTIHKWKDLNVSDNETPNDVGNVQVLEEDNDEL